MATTYHTPIDNASASKNTVRQQQQITSFLVLQIHCSDCEAECAAVGEGAPCARSPDPAFRVSASRFLDGTGSSCRTRGPDSANPRVPARMRP